VPAEPPATGGGSDEQITVNVHHPASCIFTWCDYPTTLQFSPEEYNYVEDCGDRWDCLKSYYPGFIGKGLSSVDDEASQGGPNTLEGVLHPWDNCVGNFSFGGCRGASLHLIGLGDLAIGMSGAFRTGVAANTVPARFAVNSAGEATMSLRAGSASLEVTEHAALRMTQRGISIDAAETTLARTPFPYFHSGVWKSGYYDPTSRIFLGTVGGRVTTVINGAKPGYIENLKAVVP
jgi:hypothetical protein